jgi:acetylglutamate kinase
MIPKINACVKALTVNAVTRIIDGRESHALLNELKYGKGGTTIRCR